MLRINIKFCKKVTKTMVDSHFNLIYDLMPAKKVSKPIVKPKEPEPQKRLHIETTTKVAEEVKEPSL